MTEEVNANFVVFFPNMRSSFFILVEFVADFGSILVRVGRFVKFSSCIALV